MIRFGKWQAILEEPEPAEFRKLSRAIRHYARGVAHTHLGHDRRLELDRAPATRTRTEGALPPGIGRDLGLWWWYQAGLTQSLGARRDGLIMMQTAAGTPALAWIFHGGHSHFSFEDTPAFGSLYGFVSCVAIIIVSKVIGKAWLMRREDYYDS